MAQITENGRKLASKLNPAIGTTGEILEICSLICRNAATYDRLAVEKCNGPAFRDFPHSDMPQAEYSRRMDEWQTDLENRDNACADRIRRLVDRLPLVDGERIKVRLGGDPRGCVVTLVMPGEWTRLHDSWGGESLVVPYGR